MPDNIISNALGNCNICGHKRFLKIADKLRGHEHHKVYKCMSCGHVQLLPRPRRDEEKQYYNENKQDKAIRKEINLENLQANNEYDTNRRAEFISTRFSKEMEILDVGCGYGFFLKEMSHQGYKITGVEISKERRELAKAITDCSILDVNFAETGDSKIGKFDIVTLYHVLEHTIDPIGFCRNIRQILKNNGCLIVEVPNVEELMLETCSAYNDFYWIRAHLNYFSKKTLTEVLQKAGFRKVEIIYVQRYGIENLCNWLMTGKPQIERPIFVMSEPYNWLENYYRKHLEKIRKTDTLFTIAYT